MEAEVAVGWMGMGRMYLQNQADSVAVGQGHRGIVRLQGFQARTVLVVVAEVARAKTA